MGESKPKKESKSSQFKRKKQKEKSIIQAIEKNIPNEGTTMLYQPYGITMLKGDLSPMKVNMMVELIDHFQDKMKEQLYNKAHNYIQGDLFSDGIIPPVKISFRDLEVRPDNYDELHRAAEELSTLTYETYTENEEGVTMRNILPLFSRISIPTKKIDSAIDNPDEKYNYKHNKRRLGYVEIVLNPEVGLQALTIDRSFTRYIKEMTRNRRCVYTGRLYMFISTFCNLGKWIIDYQEFRRLLGFTVAKEVNGKMVEEIVQYPNFSDVKRRVLEPPMKELKELAETGKVNCYYEYEPIYEGGKKRGNPAKLHFRIIKTDLGRALDSQTETVQDIAEIKNFLENELGLSKRDAKSLCCFLTNENKNGFRQKMMEVKAYVADPKHNVKKPHVYAITALKNWISDSIPVAEEVKDEVKNAAASKAAVATEATEDKTVEVALSSEDKDRWMKFLDYMKEDVSQDEYKTWFIYLQLLKVEENAITIGVPTKFFIDWLNGKFKEAFYKNLGKVFQSQEEVRYSVIG